MYYRWKNGRLALMVSWVDDIMALGHPEDVKQIEEDLKNAFACKSEGCLKEYVGSKVDLLETKQGWEQSKSLNLYWYKSWQNHLMWPEAEILKHQQSRVKYW